MAVLKEFTCKAHGPFEEFVEQDTTPECPKGCSPKFVTREIRTAPASRDVITGKMDGLQRDLAADFGLSNLKVDKEAGSPSVIENLRGRPQQASDWLKMPNPPAPGWSQRGEKPPAAAISGFPSENVIQKVGLKQGPTPIIEKSYRPDASEIAKASAKV